MSRPVYLWCRRTMLELSALMSALILFVMALSYLDDAGPIVRWQYTIASYETEVLVYAGWVAISSMHVQASSVSRRNRVMSYLVMEDLREAAARRFGGIALWGLCYIPDESPIYPPTLPKGVSVLPTRPSPVLLSHLAWPIALTALPPLIAVMVWYRRKPWIKPGHCAKCGYDLRASRDVCPECGAAIVEPVADLSHGA